MIHYCIPTYRSFDHCINAVLAAMQSSLLPDKYIIIDNSGDGSGTRHLQLLVEQYNNITIWPQTHNLGVAVSFNVFMQELQDHIIIANDDVFVHKDTVKTLIEAAENNPRDIFFAGSGHSGNAFSLFLLKKKGFCEIGPFDKKFYPGYYEDNDYAYRMRLRGYSIVTVDAATYDHIGSSTIKTYDTQMMRQHHYDFTKNAQYYRSKWGGMPGEEKYTEEFGFNGEI